MHVCLMSRNQLFILKKVTPEILIALGCQVLMKENQQKGSGMTTSKKYVIWLNMYGGQSEIYTPSLYFLAKLLTISLFNSFLRSVALHEQKKMHLCELSKSHTIVVWIYHDGGDLAKIFTHLIAHNIIDFSQPIGKYQKYMHSGTSVLSWC